MKDFVATVMNRISELVSKYRKRKSKRVLIHEILTLQILITGAIGAFAIASLYWGGQWVLQDNYSRWALQWTEELNELGAPLFLPGDDEVVLRLESFVAKYPEIRRVTYFRQDGSVMYSIDNQATDKVAATLSEPKVSPNSKRTVSMSPRNNPVPFVRKSLRRSRKVTNSFCQPNPAPLPTRS